MEKQFKERQESDKIWAHCFTDCPCAHSFLQCFHFHISSKLCMKAQKFMNLFPLSHGLKNCRAHFLYNLFTVPQAKGKLDLRLFKTFLKSLREIHLRRICYLSAIPNVCIARPFKTMWGLISNEFNGFQDFCKKPFIQANNLIWEKNLLGRANSGGTHFLKQTTYLPVSHLIHPPIIFFYASPCQHVPALLHVSQVSTPCHPAPPRQHTLVSSDLPSVAGSPSSRSCPSFSSHSLSLCLSLPPSTVVLTY